MEQPVGREEEELLRPIERGLRSVRLRNDEPLEVLIAERARHLHHALNAFPLVVENLAALIDNPLLFTRIRCDVQI